MRLTGVQSAQTSSSTMLGCVLRDKIAALVPLISRYMFVSVAALLLDLSVFLMTTRLEILRPALAGVIGYTLGLLCHYVLSTRFVFDVAASLKTRRRLFAEFVASGVLGLIVTWAIIHTATEWFGVGPFAAKAIAVVVSFCAVFQLRRAVVFAPAAAV